MDYEEEEERKPLSGCEFRNSHLTSSSCNSQQTSYMGDSVYYEQHLNDFQREEVTNATRNLHIQISAYTFIFMTSLCATLIANGLLITDTKISQTGCQVGLNKWFYGLTGLVLTKLVVQFLRLMHFRRYN